jgi:hypothetical protein
VEAYPLTSTSVIALYAGLACRRFSRPLFTPDLLVVVSRVHLAFRRFSRSLFTPDLLVVVSRAHLACRRFSRSPTLFRLLFSFLHLWLKGNVSCIIPRRYATNPTTNRNSSGRQRCPSIEEAHPRNGVHNYSRTTIRFTYVQTHKDVLEKPSIRHSTETWVGEWLLGDCDFASVGRILCILFFHLCFHRLSCIVLSRFPRIRAASLMYHVPPLILRLPPSLAAYSGSELGRSPMTHAFDWSFNARLSGDHDPVAGAYNLRIVYI